MYRVVSRRWIHTNRTLLGMAEDTNMRLFKSSLSLEEREMKFLMKHRGVASRIQKQPSFIDQCMNLKSQLGLSNRVLVMRLDDHLAERMSDESYLKKLISFKERLGLTFHQLYKVTPYLSIVRLNNESFVRGVEKFQQRFNLSSAQLVIVFSDTFLSRVQSDTIHENISDFQKKFNLNNSQLVSVLKNVRIDRFDTPYLLTALSDFQEAFDLSTDQIIRVLTDKVAAKLRKPSFLSTSKKLADKYNVSITRLLLILSKESDIIRWEDPNFMEAVFGFQDHFHIPTTSLIEILNDDLASFIQDPTFVETIVKFQNEFELSSQQLLLLLKGNIIARVDEPAFLDHFENKYHLPQDQMTRVTNNTLGIKIQDPEFFDTVLNFKNKLNLNKQHLIIMLGRESAIARMEDESFIEALIDFQKEFQFTTEELMKVSNNGVVSRIQDPTFLSTIIEFKKALDLSKNQLVMLLRRQSAVVRLEDPHFISAVIDFKEEFNFTKQDIITILNNTVVSRIQDPAFRNAVKIIYKRCQLQPHNLVNSLCTSIAIRIPNQKFLDAFLHFIDEFNLSYNSHLTLLFEGAICSHIMEPGFIDQLKYLKKELNLDTHEILQISNVRYFIDRIHDKKLIELLAKLKKYLCLSSTGITSLITEDFIMLIHNDNKVFEKLYNFIHILGINKLLRPGMTSLNSSVISSFILTLSPHLDKVNYINDLMKVKNIFNLNTKQLIEFFQPRTSELIQNDKFIHDLSILRKKLNIIDPQTFVNVVSAYSDEIQTIIEFEKKHSSLAVMPKGSGVMIGAFRLVKELGLNEDQLLRLLKRPYVANRLQDEEFISKIIWFQKQFSCQASIMVGILNIAVCKNITDPIFITSCLNFQKKYQLTNDEMARLYAKSNFISRLSKYKFVLAVDKLYSQLSPISNQSFIALLLHNFTLKSLDVYPQFVNDLISLKKHLKLKDSNDIPGLLRKYERDANPKEVFKELIKK